MLLKVIANRIRSSVDVTQETGVRGEVEAMHLDLSSFRCAHCRRRRRFVAHCSFTWDTLLHITDVLIQEDNASQCRQAQWLFVAVLLPQH